MIIKGTETARCDVYVEVSPVLALQAIRDDVLKSLGCHCNAYLDRKGRLIRDEEDLCGSHSSIHEIVLADPAPPQIAEAMKALNTIHAILIRD